MKTKQLFKEFYRLQRLLSQEPPAKSVFHGPFSPAMTRVLELEKSIEGSLFKALRSAASSAEYRRPGGLYDYTMMTASEAVQSAKNADANMKEIFPGMFDDLDWRGGYEGYRFKFRKLTEEQMAEMEARQKRDDAVRKQHDKEREEENAVYFAAQAV